MIALLCILILLLTVAVAALSNRVQRMRCESEFDHTYMVEQLDRTAAKMRCIAHQGQSEYMTTLRACRAISAARVRPLDFDAWLRERTERAHAEFMRRTSRPLMHETRSFTTEQIARFFNVPPELLADSE